MVFVTIFHILRAKNSGNLVGFGTSKQLKMRSSCNGSSELKNMGYLKASRVPSRAA